MIPVFVLLISTPYLLWVPVLYEAVFVVNLGKPATALSSLGVTLQGLVLRCAADGTVVCSSCECAAVSRALGDIDYKLGARLQTYQWMYPGGVPRLFTSDIVSGLPETTQASWA